MINSGDRQFLTRVAMPTFGITKVAVRSSSSKAVWPDIWTDGRSITVTKEWARQTAPERRKRLVHELLHLKGLEHGEYGSLDYNTTPSKDTYSKAVYQRLLKNPNPSIDEVRERFQDSLTIIVSQLTHLFPGKVTSRLKTVASIEEKLVRKGKPLTAMTDIAGARVVFPTLETLYAGLQQIRRRFEIVEEQDYISQPKIEGYRSYHLLILSNGLPVEVQLKTPRMLEWGEIGHIVPLYKDYEALREQYGKSAKKLAKYNEWMAEHYWWSDVGKKMKRPKVPRLWQVAGFPMFTLNPVCPECGTPNPVRQPGVRCTKCGRYLIMRRRT